MAWTVLIPVKRLERAKSRLVAHGLGVSTTALALAFADDTVAAAVATPGVDRVVVVTDDEAVAMVVRRLGALVRPDPGGGLNAALLIATGPGAVAALPSDLPALTPVALAAALVAAAPHPRAFVADGEGVGTTLLTARDGRLDPRYGPGSALAHERSGAVRLRGPWPALARDVDTPQALSAARALGLGPATSALLTPAVTLCSP